MGEDQKKYHVHKALLCKRVGYFAAAYRTNMEECADDTFCVDDVSDLAFRSLISWLYTGKVFLIPGSQSAAQVGEPFLETTDDMDEDYVLPSWQPEYDAVSDTDSQIDYEYDEGPDALEPDHIELDTIISVVDLEKGGTRTTWAKERPREGENLEQLEQRIVEGVFPQTLATSLNTRQLSILLRIAHAQATSPQAEERTFVPFVAKWTDMLERSSENVDGEASEMGNSDDEDVESNAFALLVDLYIVADRFDVPLLRREVMDLVQTEHDNQIRTLGGNALPPFDVVAHAFENLPSGSALRQWLLHVFAYRWSPYADTQEERAARDRLPRDFLLELAIILAERSSWATDESRFPMYTACACCPELRAPQEEESRMTRNAMRGLSKEYKSLV